MFVESAPLGGRSLLPGSEGAAATSFSPAPLVQHYNLHEELSSQILNKWADLAPKIYVHMQLQ